MATLNLNNEIVRLGASPTKVHAMVQKIMVNGTHPDNLNVNGLPLVLYYLRAMPLDNLYWLVAHGKVDVDFVYGSGVYETSPLYEAGKLPDATAYNLLLPYMRSWSETQLKLALQSWRNEDRLVDVCTRLLAKPARKDGWWRPVERFIRTMWGEVSTDKLWWLYTGFIKKMEAHPIFAQQLPELLQPKFWENFKVHHNSDWLELLEYLLAQGRLNVPQVFASTYYQWVQRQAEPEKAAYYLQALHRLQLQLNPRELHWKLRLRLWCHPIPTALEANLLPAT
jgi:hypothetical protein